MNEENLKAFFFDVVYALVMHFSAWRWRRTAMSMRFVCLHFMNVGQLQLSTGKSAPISETKDQVYVSPLPASIPELKVRIRTASETITADMLQTVAV
jgi:hypothetical protein